LLDETLAQMLKTKRFTKLDIQQAFYCIRIATPKDEDLMTFRTRYRLYKYIVMPFGLTNALATFQHYINDVLFEFLGNFALAYIDDILIYSNSAVEHREHV
jgi:Reverse transcriptase (RNA-dependent DNA polymerase)